MDPNDSAACGGALDRMANSLPLDDWDTACQRMADQLNAPTEPDWRALTIRLATAAESTASIARRVLELAGGRNAAPTEGTR